MRASSLVPALLAALASVAPATAVARAPRVTSRIAQIPAVALSYDGQHLAWIVASPAGNRVELAGWSGRNPTTLAIPGDCRATGLRWSPRWYDLAVMATCPGSNGGSTRSVLWVVDVSRTRTPRKIADIEGNARRMQWSANLKRIAFLYLPVNNAAQSVASVSATGGQPQVMTPPNLYVHEFRLSRAGDRVAYTAVPVVDGTRSGPANLYVQAASAGAAPRALVQATGRETGARGTRISVLRWSAWDTRVFFLAGRARHDIIGGALCAVSAAGGSVACYRDLGRHGQPAYWYTFMRNRLYMVTPAGHDGLAFSRYAFNSPGSIRSVRGYFTLAGVIGDGRAPYAVSMAWRHWPRIAFAQASATQAPEVRSGLLTPSTPPVVTTISAGARAAPAAADREAGDAVDATAAAH